jgi:Uma2 family endonuclease
MTVALRQALTVEDYLAWADSQSERRRTELINGQIVPMPAERVAHGRAKSSALFELKRAIKAAGLPCEALPDGMAVPIDPHTAYEPDALVYCGDKLPPSSLIVPNPIIVVEVLSPTTAHHDTSAKLIGYFKLPSMQHYLVIDPEARNVTHYARGEIPVLLAEGDLGLHPPGLSLTVSDLLGPA